MPLACVQQKIKHLVDLASSYAGSSVGQGQADLRPELRADTFEGERLGLGHEDAGQISGGIDPEPGVQGASPAVCACRSRHPRCGRLEADPDAETVALALEDMAPDHDRAERRGKVV